MRYPTVSRKRRGQMTATALAGGLNIRDLPTEVADDQLTDGRNFWWRDGVLRTRPALRVADRGQPAVARVYSNGTGDACVMRLYGGALTTGAVGADGVQTWNRDTLPATESVLRVPFDVRRLPAWTAGDGDGTILFLGDGRVVAPLAAGGYQSLEPFVYVPQLLAGGVGVANLLDPPPVMDILEEPNCLTTAFRAGYTTDGNGRLFYLPVDKLDATHPITATYTDENGFTISHTIPAGKNGEGEVQEDGFRMVLLGFRRCVCFESADGKMQAPPAAGISDNLMVTAHMAAPVRDAGIERMRFGCWFGGESSGLFGGMRLFLGGDPQHPERICWSAAENPLYFPANNYLSVGDMAQAVTAFGKQGNMLVIFKERELYAASYDTPVSGMPAGACVSVFPLHSEIGCDCPNTIRLCQNRLVWLSSEGQVYTLVAGNAYSGSNVRPIAALVAPALRKKAVLDLQSASAACFEGWYLLLVGREIWLFRYADTAFERITAYTTADEQVQKGMVWHCWNFDIGLIPERLVPTRGGAVLFDNAGRSYVFGGVRDTVVVGETEQERSIQSRLTTASFDFGYTDIQKTVRELTAQVGVADDCELTVTYLTDRGQQSECRVFRGVAADERTAGFWKLLRLTPHAARVRHFGWSLTADGAVVLGQILVRYDIENITERRGGLR